MRSVRSRQFDRDIKIIRRYVSAGTILDVGSSYGIFLDKARQKGYSVVGIEPSTSTITLQKKLFPKVQTIKGEFEKSKFGNRQFDVVTLWSVLEHTINPVAVLKKIKKITRSGSLLAIRVPDADGLLVKIIWLLHQLSGGRITGPSKSLYLLDYNYKHFYHFSLSTLKLLLSKAGLRIVHYYRENSLNRNHLKERAFASLKKSDVDFLKNPLVRNSLKLFLALCDWLGWQDEIVVFAQRPVKKVK